MANVTVIGEMKNYAGDHEAFQAARKIAAKVWEDLQDEKIHSECLEQRDTRDAAI